MEYWKESLKRMDGLRNGIEEYTCLILRNEEKIRRNLDIMSRRSYNDHEYKSLERENENLENVLIKDFKEYLKQMKIELAKLERETPLIYDPLISF